MAQLPPVLSGPALVLAAFPAFATIGLIGILILAASGKRLAPEGVLGDSFELWRDRSGAAREMKLVGLRNHPGGSRAEFVTRDGVSVVQPIAGLQRSDQTRAWDAAFSLEPVFTFKESRIVALHPLKKGSQKYRIEYDFEISGLPVARIDEASLKINRVPIEGVSGMSVHPSDWQPQLRRSSRDSGSAMGKVRSLLDGKDRFQLVTSGLYWPPSVKDAHAEGSVRVLCLGDLDEQVVSLTVPPRGKTTSNQVGPLRLILKSDADSGTLELQVNGGTNGLCYAGFQTEGRWSNERSAPAYREGSLIKASVGYYRRVKIVEVPFSGTAH